MISVGGLSGPALALILALVLEATLGASPAALSPAAWIGRLIAGLARVPVRGAGAQLVLGTLMALLVPCLFAGGGLLLGWANLPEPIVLVASVLLLRGCLTLRATARTAEAVREALARDRMSEARAALVAGSPEPASLDQRAPAAAAIESLAQSLSHGFVAPILYYALFGVPGALFQGAVHTMDAMLAPGERRTLLGKPAARLRQLIELVPSWLATGALLAAGGLRGLEVRRGWATLQDDGAHRVPLGAAGPAAVMAGLLRIPLTRTGDGQIDEAGGTLAPVKIDEAWRTVKLAGLLVTAAAVWWLQGRHAFLL
jgi:adenosylcobinamide-phosphate synthase